MQLTGKEPKRPINIEKDTQSLLGTGKCKLNGELSSQTIIFAKLVFHTKRG